MAMSSMSESLDDSSIAIPAGGGPAGIAIPSSSSSSSSELEPALNRQR